ncbi:unnamed protein product [Camellia sinensis]
MDAIDELAQLADSMRQASALLADEDVDENSSSLHRPFVLAPPFHFPQCRCSRQCCFLLLARVIAVTFCVTLATSLAARLGATPMAAFQICLQVWMTSSLLSDGMAIAGQTMLSLLVRLLRRIMRKQKLLQPECCRWHLGLRLAVVVGLRLQFGSGIFTKDKNVVHLISIGIPCSGICSEHCVFIPSLEKPRFCWNMVWFNHFYGSTCIFWDFESITQSRCSLPITLPSDKLSSSDESLRFYSKICK